MSSDASDKKQPTAAEKKKAAERILADLKKKGKEEKEKKRQKGSAHTRFLKKQLKFKQEKWEYQKKRAKERAKEEAEKEPLRQARKSLASIKSEKISEKDKLGTAYAKTVGNIGSFASGVAGAAFHGARALAAKKKAEKEAEAKQREKRERKSPGRPKAERPKEQSGTQTSPEPQNINLKKEPKRLVPSTKRLVPSTKRLPPSGGVPEGSREPKAKTLGQRARQNPKIKAGLISQRMNTEAFSNWRDEIIFENNLLFEVEIQKENNKKNKKVIDVLSGKKKNNIIMNPELSEDHKEIASGKKKDDEGYMANVELDQMERAIKALRKKVKRADTQLPAWVQSKITRAADYIDTASEYLQSDEGLSEEKDEKRYCKLCRKEEAKGECSYGPSMWEKYTISEMAPLVAALGRVALGAGTRTAATTGARAAVSSSLKDAAKEKVLDITKSKVQSALERAGKKVNYNNTDSVSQADDGATAYKKVLPNIFGEEVDKKKILMAIVLKALEDKKRKKNSQLINGIIGEAKKSEMKCNKPKAQAHGSGETGKSHVVKACEGGKEKLIRFGQLGVKGSPKKEGESEAYASRRHRFQTRHAKNIAKGKMSAAYWANKVKW